MAEDRQPSAMLGNPPAGGAGKQRAVRVEVAYATREEQVLVSLKLEAGATVRQAIERSGIPQRFPEIAPAGLTAGIFGRVTPPDTLLRDGDRVEIYRPIAADPKDARHRRVARAKRTRAR